MKLVYNETVLLCCFIDLEQKKTFVLIYNNNLLVLFFIFASIFVSIPDFAWIVATEDKVKTCFDKNKSYRSRSLLFNFCMKMVCNSNLMYSILDYINSIPQWLHSSQVQDNLFQYTLKQKSIMRRWKITKQIFATIVIVDLWIDRQRNANCIYSNLNEQKVV